MGAPTLTPTPVPTLALALTLALNVALTSDKVLFLDSVEESEVDQQWEDVQASANIPDILQRLTEVTLALALTLTLALSLALALALTLALTLTLVLMDILQRLSEVTAVRRCWW